MTLEKSIAQLLADFRKIVKFVTRYSVVDAIIESVDETKFTCSVRIQKYDTEKSTDAIYDNVPLKVLRGSQASFVEIPKLKTRCEICFRDNNNSRPQILMIHECDKILVKIGNQTLQASSDGWVFNGGSLDGMVKINDLVTKLNNLENDLNTLKTVFNTWVPVSMDGGAALKTAATTWMGQTLTPTTKSNLENTKIKQ